MNIDCTVDETTQEYLNNAVECFRSKDTDTCESKFDQLDFIDHGKERRVYRHPKLEECVVKITQNEGEWEGGNAREIEITEESSPVSEWLVDVHDYGEDAGWLTMPEMETGLFMSPEDLQEFDQYMENIGWECYDADFNNFGYKNGKWYLFDFASCKRL